MSDHNDVVQFGVTRPIPDALALEYKGDYGTARRDLDIADLVNNPAANGECRVFGLGFQEQPLDLFSSERRALLKDLPDAALVREDSV